MRIQRRKAQCMHGHTDLLLCQVVLHFNGCAAMYRKAGDAAVRSMRIGIVQLHMGQRLQSAAQGLAVVRNGCVAGGPACVLCMFQRRFQAQTQRQRML